MARESDRLKYTVKLSRASLIQAFQQGERNLPFQFMIKLSNGNVHWVQHNITLAKQPGTEDIISFMAVRDISTEKFTNEIMGQIVSKKLDYICCISARTGKIVLFFSGIDSSALYQVKQDADYDDTMIQYNQKYVPSEEKQNCISFMKLDHIKKELMKSDHLEKVFSCDEGKGLRIVHVEYFWLDKENELIVLTRTDITEAQRQQMEHEKELKAANKAKSDFLSRMSHDIRTPLNGIIGMTYLTKTEKNPEKIQENLQKIDTSSKFLLGLINDVLDMSKAESGKIELHPEPYPTQEFLSYIDAVIKPLTQERNQTFLCDNEMPEDVIPVFDKLRINQIFFNLLSNAVKYTPEGGKIEFYVRTKYLSEQEISIHAEVKDNGIGISEEFQKIIFDPFSQEGRNDVSLQRGTGLGMAITKQLVTLMHGTISVKSTLGKGSTFTVDLPVEYVHQEDVYKALPVKQGSIDKMDELLAGKHVLLCEDHPLNQEIARALLEQKKMIVTTAEDGKIGAERFRDSIPNYYDVILMDIRMPIMDGYEATKAIRSMHRIDAETVPIIAMTADAFADDVQKCLHSGMNSHLAKPIEPEVLYQTLCSAIEKKHS
jgi:signal transduction histidine kinase/CheY-like chemotaxis protein